MGPGLLTSTASPILTRLISGGGTKRSAGPMGQFRRRLATQEVRPGLVLDEVLGHCRAREDLLFGWVLVLVVVPVVYCNYPLGPAMT